MLIFVTLRYWIEHAALLGMALSGLGHDVTLAYLPYANWRKALNRFDLRRHNAYSQSVLSQAQPYLHAVSWLDTPCFQAPAPAGLKTPSERLPCAMPSTRCRSKRSTRRAQLYRLRLERDLKAGRAALAWIQAQPPGCDPDPERQHPGDGRRLPGSPLRRVSRW